MKCEPRFNVYIRSTTQYVLHESDINCTLLQSQLVSFENPNDEWLFHALHTVHIVNTPSNVCDDKILHL